MDSLFTIACPTCTARLKVRDAGVIGRIVTCPKCESMVQVEPPAGWSPPDAPVDSQRTSEVGPSNATDDGSPTADSAASTADKPQPNDEVQPTTEGFHEGWSSNAERRWKRFALLGTLAATLLVLAFGGWRYLAGRTSPPAEVAAGAGHAPSGTPESAPSEALREPAATPSNTVDAVDDADSAPPVLEDLAPNRSAPAESRLSETRPGADNLRVLLPGLSGYQNVSGAFPQATAGHRDHPPEKQLSWLALLLDHYGHSNWRAELRFDRAWDQDTNRAVARRPLQLVVNSAIDHRVNEEGFALTHFVGLAGVGADAAELPADHPRAGVFGYERRLSAGRASDGQSDTIALLGVNERLGPWAQGGAATVRSFTEKPYVNGPDGFGTGQPNGMLAGMLDGSVRFIANDIDPFVLEQLATASGYRPESVAGAPSTMAEDRSPVTTVQGQAQGPVRPPRDSVASSAMPPAADDSTAPPVAPPEVPPEQPKPPAVDVTERLAETLPEIEFVSVPLGKFVQFISEMSSVPITLELDTMQDTGVPSDVFVTVRASDATLSEILDAALAPHDLVFHEIDAQIIVGPRPFDRDNMSTVRYRVDDLTGNRPADISSFGAMLQRLVAPDSWMAEAAGPEVTIRGDSLVIRQRAIVHDQILQLCEKLRLAQGRPLRGGNRGRPVRLETRSALARAALETPVRATFFEPTLLSQMASYVADAADVRILFDWRSMWSAGVFYNVEGVLHCNDCRLEEALEALTDPFDLTYRIVDARTFEITSRSADAARSVLEVYSIGELVAEGKRADAVIGSIEKAIAGTGPRAEARATIEFDSTSRTLLVLCGQHTQRRIERLLAGWTTEAGPAEAPPGS